MKLLKKEGFDFSFNPDKCAICNGKCCIGESGYIWVNSDEIKSISKFLNLDVENFKLDYLRKFGYKFSLKEIKYESGYACVFFDFGSKRCQIYEQRPTQCRTFPFWNYFKTHQKELEEECIGILPLS